MGKNKLYKAFANYERLKLLKCLTNPKNVTELLSHCSLTQSALSQHLKVLREAELVKTERSGKEIVYHLKNKTVTKIADLLLNFK